MSTPTMDLFRALMEKLLTRRQQPIPTPASAHFDPEGSGYDYESAIAAGLQPDETGHWPSRDPYTGLLLKGRNHETWDKTVNGENAMGYDIAYRNGRYYSFPRLAPSHGQAPAPPSEPASLPGMPVAGMGRVAANTLTIPAFFPTKPTIEHLATKGTPFLSMAPIGAAAQLARPKDNKRRSTITGPDKRRFYFPAHMTKKEVDEVLGRIYNKPSQQVAK